MGRTLMIIPLFLGGAVAVFAVAPRFATMAVAKVASKCFDYSIFRAAKEILYIPLSHEEKTQGKALIDILTYRVAKGAVSALLLLLQWLALSGVWLLSGITLTVVAVWLGTAVAIARRHAARMRESAP